MPNGKRRGWGGRSLKWINEGVKERGEKRKRMRREEGRAVARKSLYNAISEGVTFKSNTIQVWPHSLRETLSACWSKRPSV